LDLIHATYEPPGPGPHPTILALHGWGANALDLLGLAPHICDGRFLFLCPQGPVETPIGAGRVGYGWFPLSLDQPPDMMVIHSTRDQLKTFLESCLERYPVDPKKLVVLGFSQGGVMAFSLAFSEPERFSALTVLSSWLPAELAAPSLTNKELNLPTLIQHGSEDELLEIERARESVETLRTLHVPLTYREYAMGHQITAQSLTDLSAWLEEKVLSPLILPG